MNYSISKGQISKQPNPVKRELHDAIKNNDYNKTVQIIIKHSVDPHEEISAPGFLWSPIHYACHFKCPKILEYLLIKAYSHYNSDYVSILNTSSKDGWTPVMVAGIYQSMECLNLLIKYGGIYTDLKDSNGKTASQLAEYYGATACFEMLKSLPPFIPIKPDAFQNAKLEPAHLETDNDANGLSAALENLYINGTLKPCLYCFSNIGYIRYSKCCGHPMHKACLKEKDMICKGCFRSDTEVHGKIEFPDKAFEGRNYAGK